MPPESHPGSPFAAPARALVRGVPDSFTASLHESRVALDPERARAQVEAYARALEACGIAVSRLAGDEACPDACFSEDTAVVLSAGQAFVSRPGAPSRRPEVAPVAAALAGLSLSLDLSLAEAGDESATLDGGDVLRLGDTYLIGLSARTSGAGADALAAACARLGLKARRIPVRGALHLKSLLSLAGPRLAVGLAGSGLGDVLAPHGIRLLETDEPAGANVLALGQTLLVSSEAPETAKRLAREPAIRVVSLDVSELHKADGALTCLSLRIPPPGHWCA